MEVAGRRAEVIIANPAGIGAATLNNQGLVNANEAVNSSAPSLARTGDAQTAIGQIFGKERVKDEVGAQVAITKAFGQQATTAIGTYATGQLQ